MKSGTKILTTSYAPAYTLGVFVYTNNNGASKEIEIIGSILY